MVLEIFCVEPIYPQYSGVLETCLALRFWFFEVLGSESVNNHYIETHVMIILILMPICKSLYPRKQLSIICQEIRQCGNIIVVLQTTQLHTIIRNE